MGTNKYAWSVYKWEDWYTETANTIKQCKEDAKEQYPYKHTVYIGRCHPYEVYGPSASQVIDLMDEEVSDYFSAGASEWKSFIPDGAEARLQDLLNEAWQKWTSEFNIDPGYFQVKDIKEYKI